MKQTLHSFIGHIMLLLLMLVPQTTWALSGDGSANNRYKIWSAADLAEFRDIVNGGTKTDYIYADLKADITLSGNWTPIGTEKNPFYGYFDGYWHSITGLNIEYTGNCQGLFGCVGGKEKETDIGRFTISGTMKSGTSKLSKIGTVVGYAKKKVHVKFVTSNVDIKLQNNAVHSHVGGIVGYAEDYFSITYCKYSGTLDLGKSKDCLGGICGYIYRNYDGYIEDCIFCGSLKTASTDNNSTYVGGILGYNNQDDSSNLTIKICLSAGTISTESGVKKYVGGIIGNPQGKAANEISNCYVINGLSIHGNGKTTGGSNCSLNDVKSGKITYLLGKANIAAIKGGFGYWRQNIGSEDYPRFGKSDVDDWNGYVFKVDAKYCTGETLDEFYSNYNGAAVLHKNYDTEFTVDKQPACTVNGSKSKHCKNYANCGAKIEVTSIPALGHTFESDITIDKESTCTEDGSKSKHCIHFAECGAKSEVTAIPAKGHTYESDFTIDKEHSCTEDGSKSKHCIHFDTCGGKSEVTVIPAHTFESDFTIDMEPTCTTDGSKSKHCIHFDTCGGKSEVTAIPAAHTLESDFTIDMEPACATDGIKSKHCIHFDTCGGKSEVTSIPAKGHDFDSYGQCKNCDATCIYYFAHDKVEPNNDNFFDKDGNKLDYIEMHDTQEQRRFVFNGKLATIGEGAFMNCKKLLDIYIPSSVTSIGEKAFYGCSSLSYVIDWGTTPQPWAEDMFNNMDKIEFWAPCANIEVYKKEWPGFGRYKGIHTAQNDGVCSTCHEKVYTILKYTANEKLPDLYSFKDADGYSLSYLDSYDADTKQGVIKIGGILSWLNYSFANCSQLTSVEIPNSVKWIGDGAFQNCPALTSIVIPDSVEGIGNNAFEDCSALKSVTIGKSVKCIGYNAFGECSALNSIVIPDSVESIDCCAFRLCQALESVSFGKCLKKISEGAFADCNKLTSVSLPDSVRYLYSEAFVGCSSLKSVELNSLPLIYDDTFDQGVDISLSLTDHSYVYGYGDYNGMNIANADYSRDIKANWNTICLPFTAKSTEDTKFYTVSSLEDGVITLKYAETLPAGYPALVNTVSKSKLTIKSQNTDVISSPHSIDDYSIIMKSKKRYEVKGFGNSVLDKAVVDIAPLNDEAYDDDYEMHINEYRNSGLEGTFKATTVYGASNTYNLFYGLSANTGKYVKITSDVALKPFRAFIVCKKNAANEAGLRSVIADNEAVNAVETLDALNSADAQYFDINGRKQDGLRQGMNIIKVNGKATKVIIK